MILLLLWLAAAQAPLPEEQPILAEIQQYDEQIRTVDEQIAALAGQADARAAELDRRAVQAEDARRRIDEARGPTVEQLRRYYQVQRRGVARLLFDAESPGELRRRVRYLLAILRAQQARQAAWQALLTERAAVEEALAADRAAVASLREELDARRAQLAAERDRRVQLLRAVRGSREMAGRAVREVGAAQATLGESVRITEATAPASAVGNLTAVFRGLRGRLPRPASGPVVRGFGPGSDPVSGERFDNLGVDIAAPLGSPFRAVADGTVTRSGYTRGYGQMVMVQHGAYTTLYAHANGLRVAQGQEVRAGDVLGLVGNTGLVDDDAPRLHFEVRYNGTPQDPSDWLGP